MADGRKHCRLSQVVLRRDADTVSVNQARALRVAELMNDYRTLLVHISQLNVSVPPEDRAEEGYRELRDCLAAANALMASSYSPSPPPANASSEEAEQIQLRRYL
jgi:hypothetical protein